MTEVYFWLRKNSLVVFFLVYATLSLTLVIFSKGVLFKLGILATLLSVIVILGRSRHNYFYKAGAFFFLLLVLMYDEIIVPDILTQIRIRYVLPFLLVLALLIPRKLDLIKAAAFFLFLTNTFLIIHLLYKMTEKHSFVINEKPANLPYMAIQSGLEKGEKIAVLMLDGYPSDSVMYKYYQVKSGLKNILNTDTGYILQTKYISSPLSVTHLLFGAEYGDSSQYFKHGQNVFELFDATFKQSSLKKVLGNKKAKWMSFIASKEYADEVLFHNWSQPFRCTVESISATFPFMGIAYTDGVINYNNYVLKEMEKMKSDTADLNFIHFFTFHQFQEVPQEMKYADSIAAEAYKRIPSGYRVIVFSDHGVRDKGMTDPEERSGIFYTTIKE